MGACKLSLPCIGTSPSVVGTPNEQIGYLASEEYAQRMASSRPQSATYHNKAHSNSSQPHIESPLRKTSFPVDVLGKKDFEKNKGSFSDNRPQSDIAVESEAEDEDVIHVDAPSRRQSKYGGGGYDPPTEDLGPHGGNTAEEGGWLEERGYGVPILASDEVAKEQGSEYMQPAVSPPQERRGSNYFAELDPPPSYQSGVRSGSRASSVSGSRPTSRPASIHSGLRFNTHDDREDLHTPLEDVEEYEPLFPDEESKNERPLTSADRFKRRPDTTKRRFPSQDIWEDTPNSLQLQTTVSTPELEEEKGALKEKPASAVFEPPQTESSRKGEISEEEKANLIPKEQRWANSNFKLHLRDENSGRLGLKQRFPSRDIWEDTPDSARLETTVEGPQSDELKSPPDEGLVAGAVVTTAGRPENGKPVNEESGATPTRIGATSGKPAIPPRPTKSKLSEGLNESAGRQQQNPAFITTSQERSSTENQPEGTAPAKMSPTKGRNDHPFSPTEARKGPVLPDRPKPQVPARPAKPTSRDSSETVPLSKTTSATSATSVEDGSGSSKEMGSAPAVKAKPALPSRPLGSKIASLKAGFLSDLDKRLQLGPQAPKQQEKTLEVDKEEEIEKAPLSDTRKGRARGPVRRKPAAPSSAVAGEAPTSEGGKFEIAAASTIWQIRENGDLRVSSTEEPFSTAATSESTATQNPPPSLATNTAGESLPTSDQATFRGQESAFPPSSAENQAPTHEKATPKLDLTASDSKPSDTTGLAPTDSSEPRIPSGKRPTGTDDPTQSPSAATRTARDNLTKMQSANPLSPTTNIEQPAQPASSHTSEQVTSPVTASGEGQSSSKLVESREPTAAEEGDVIGKESYGDE